MKSMSVLNNISISTFNCQGFKFRNFEYIGGLFNSVDVLILQEHWLFDFEFNIFNKVLPNCKVIAKSGMETDNINSGRPYGGVAIIWKKNLSGEIVEIPTLSNRLCAVRFSSSKSDLLIFSVYMPCNTNSNENEFYDILCDIKSICDSFEDSDVLIGGDFNCDISRGDLRSEVFLDFLNANCLLCPTLESKFNIHHTFINSLNQTSLIDHFCISSRIHNKLDNLLVYDEGDNLSDHCPLVLSFYLNSNKISNTTVHIESCRGGRVCLDRASDNDKK